MAGQTSKKQSRFQPVFMTLDMNGRLVANSKVVFASQRVQGEIAATRVLGQKLRDQALRERQRASASEE